MNGSDGPKVLSAEAQSVLNEGICLVLSRWTALQAAVENEWGGRDSRRRAERTISDVLAWFTESKEPLYIDDLETILEEALMDLNTMAEDGSIEEVAYELMSLHEECLDGNYQTVDKMKGAGFRMAARANVTMVSNGNDDEDDDSEDDDDDNGMGDGHMTNMMVDAPEHQSNPNPVDMPVDKPVSKPVVEAEDGWTVVSSRRNKGKRN